MTARILTGDRPTGPLHLGHYAGSLAERLRFQNQPDTECFFIIADYQVMTDRTETDGVEGNILEVALDYLAIGIDPGKSVIFIQSRVPQLADLFMFFSMITTMAKVGRNPTVKEEVRAAGLELKMSLGMYSYPVSQAADILLFQATHVPVGEDQLPHLEMTREIARTFNNLYGQTFVIPDPVVSRVPKLLGLDASQKMSKSRGNTINLSDDPTTVQKKIKGATTDSGREVVYDPEGKPAVSNLLLMYQLVTGEEMDLIVARFSGQGYGVLKGELADALNAFLDPIRTRRKQYEGDLAFVSRVLREGTARATTEAERTMGKVREAVHYDYPKIYSA